MTSKSRRNIRLIGICVALCLSLASYVTLHVLEQRPIQPGNQEILAEELESGEALPDVQLLKKLMHKTLEFMLSVPRMEQ